MMLMSVSLAAETATPDWVKITDNAGWQARDSMGEVVFKDQIWILGGWFDSYHPPPRDVWSSADGKTWKMVTKEAPWKHSDLPMTLTFKDRMWLMGGWYNGRLKGCGSSNEVWSSTDGVKWEQATPKAGWTPRLAGAVVEFKGRMWMLGGIENYYFGDQRSLKNDVWSSADGKEWKQETAAAPWAPRAYHQAVVHDGKIWVFGGGNYVPEYFALNDVWCSADGVKWEQVAANAPWGGRLWFSAVTYRDHMWILGGWTKPYKNWGDIWYSKNGKDWMQFKSPVSWKERHEHSAYIFQDKIFVAGGHAEPLNNEVWSLELPKNWNGTP
jgi:hypothetical protein